jgi:hypothetical protein
MKLAAIANSGERAKDFVDVYYLLKEMPLNDMFEYYKKKYNQNDIVHVKRSLISFEDVPENNWKTVNLLQGWGERSELQQNRGIHRHIRAGGWMRDDWAKVEDVTGDGRGKVRMSGFASLTPSYAGYTPLLQELIVVCPLLSLLHTAIPFQAL